MVYLYSYTCKAIDAPLAGPFYLQMLCLVDTTSGFRLDTRGSGRVLGWLRSCLVLARGGESVLGGKPPFLRQAGSSRGLGSGWASSSDLACRTVMVAPVC